jgi:hypothetical protein
VSGTGTVVTALEDSIPVTYSLSLFDVGTTDSFFINFNGIALEIFVAGANYTACGDVINIQDCTTFPTTLIDNGTGDNSVSGCWFNLCGMEAKNRLIKSFFIGFNSYIGESLEYIYAMTIHK